MMTTRRSLTLRLALGTLLALIVILGCEFNADKGEVDDVPVETSRAPEPSVVDPGEPTPNPAPPSAPDSRPETLFLGEPEAAARTSLATGEIAEIEKGRGGRSLAFKITLVDGTVGYFKPEQSFSAAHWYAELASYYLDRELGLGRVPPSVGRRMPWAPLRAIAGRDDRVSEIAVQEDGTVRGAFIWWVPGGLEPIDPPTTWAHWLRVEPGGFADPFQRPRDWSAGARVGAATPSDPDRPGRPSELSTMILFDYLTTNVDRWGGDFTNVRVRGDGGALVYLDNGAGFTAGPRARIPLMDARLHTLQRFDRAIIERIRGLDRIRLEARMADDPLAPILNERQLEHLEERRRHLLEHVEATVERFGEEAVFLPAAP
jgi:hypothetical protein